MKLRRSSYVQVIRLGRERSLLINALSQSRFVVDADVADIVDWLAEPRNMPADMHVLAEQYHWSLDTIAACLATLMEQGVLTDKDPGDEQADLVQRLTELHGRDPGEALDRLRRRDRQGSEPYWSVTSARGVEDLGSRRHHQLAVLLFGDCEIQMESDFLRQDAQTRGVDLRVSVAFQDDLRLAAEREHHAILIGALRMRRALVDSSHEVGVRLYLEEARLTIEGLRRFSNAPILIDNLPEPTVQPLGFADRGSTSHRNRFRTLALKLEELVAHYPGVYVVDIAAALAAKGTERFLDDGLVGFTHFGSPGWMLQRPSSELAAVHGLFPDMGAFATQLGGNAYARELITASAHMDALSVVVGLNRKKCVIVDLDNTLWPGVLAETGAPFAWSPEISGLYSYIGLYVGIHEALKSLKRRGIVLACVSKNDEAVVRDLWRYPETYPLERLLTPDDFVTWRVNWSDKPSNIRSIAEELNFALDTFLFIDDNPVERERVRRDLPDVDVLGDDLFALRRILLSDPRLQSPVVTSESATRTDLIKAQLGRERSRATSTDEAELLASFGVVCTFARPKDLACLNRVEELFQRTTQFNTTGRQFPMKELLSQAENGRVFVAHVRDRFGDYGMVAAAVVVAGEVLALAMSCRVIGLGVERDFLNFIAHEETESCAALVGRIIETPRNGPVRHLYADNGFARHGDLWRRPLSPSQTAEVE